MAGCVEPRHGPFGCDMKHASPKAKCKELSKLRNFQTYALVIRLIRILPPYMLQVSMQQ